MAAVVALLVLVGLALFWWRVEPLVRRALAARERELALAEQAASAVRPAPASAPVSAPFSPAPPPENAPVTAGPSPEPVATAPAPKPAPKRPPVALPFTFADLANGESEEWARDDVRGALEEAFDAAGDWNRVTVDGDAVRVADILPEKR